MRKTVTRTLSASLLFSLLGLVLVIWLSGARFQLSALTDLSATYVGFAVLSMLLSMLFACLRFLLIFSLFGKRLVLLSAFRSQILQMFGSAVTPGGSGGTPLLAWMLEHFGLRRGQAWAAAIYIFAADAVFFSWALPLSLITALRIELFPVNAITLSLSVLTIVLTLLFSYVLLFRLEWLGGVLGLVMRGYLLRWRKGVLRFLQQVVVANDTFKAASVTWHLLMHSLTALAWGCIFAVLYFLATSADLSVSMLALQVGQIILIVLSFVVPTPGASGYFEASTSYLLLGKGSDDMVAPILALWRFLTFYLIILLGLALGGYLLLFKVMQAEASDADAI